MALSVKLYRVVGKARIGPAFRLISDGEGRRSKEDVTCRLRRKRSRAIQAAQKALRCRFPEYLQRLCKKNRLLKRLQRAAAVPDKTLSRTLRLRLTSLPCGICQTGESKGESIRKDVIYG
jgi:hypothetical protein